MWNDSRWTVFGMMISVLYLCLYMCAVVVLQLIHTTLCHSHSPHTIRLVCVCVLILWINRLWYELMSLHKWETVCLCRSRTEKIMSSPSFTWWFTRFTWIARQHWWWLWCCAVPNSVFSQPKLIDGMSRQIVFTNCSFTIHSHPGKCSRSFSFCPLWICKRFSMKTCWRLDRICDGFSLQNN